VTPAARHAGVVNHPNNAPCCTSDGANTGRCRGRRDEVRRFDGNAGAGPSIPITTFASDLGDTTVILLVADVMHDPAGHNM
jgi:hypothetical protein